MRAIEERASDTGHLLGAHVARLWFGAPFGRLCAVWLAGMRPLIPSFVRREELDAEYVRAHERASDRRRLRRTLRRQQTQEFKDALRDPEMGPVLLTIREQVKSRLEAVPANRWRALEQEYRSRHLRPQRTGSDTPTLDALSAVRENWPELRGWFDRRVLAALRAEFGSEEAIRDELMGFLYQAQRADCEIADKRVIEAMGLPLEPAALLVSFRDLFLNRPLEVEEKLLRGFRTLVQQAFPLSALGKGSAGPYSQHRQDLSLNKTFSSGGSSLDDFVADTKAEIAFETAGIRADLFADFLKLPPAQRRAVGIYLEHYRNDREVKDLCEECGENYMNTRKNFERARRALLKRVRD